MKGFLSKSSRPVQYRFSEQVIADVLLFSESEGSTANPGTNYVADVTPTTIMNSTLGRLCATTNAIHCIQKYA
jgi:hypothetical protein